MAYDYSQAGYSPEILDYITGLDAQRNNLIGKYAGQNVGLDNPDFLTPQQVQQEASDGFTTQYAPEEVIREYMSRNPLNSANNLNAGVDVRSYGDSRDPSVYDMVRLPFGDDYTFTNKATGQTYNASTPEQLQSIRQMVSGLSTIGTAPMPDSTFGGGNNIANWEISNGAGERIAYDSPYTPSFLKQAGQSLADQAPAALGAAIGGPLGAAALTSAYKGFGQGASLEDSLKGGAIAGAKVLAMNAIGPYISSGLTSAGLDFPGMDYIFPKDPNFFGSLGVTYGGPSVVGGVEGVTTGVTRGLPLGASSFIPAAFTGGFGDVSTPQTHPDYDAPEKVTVSDNKLVDEYGAPLYFPSALPSPSQTHPDYDAAEKVRVSHERDDYGAPLLVGGGLGAAASLTPGEQWLTSQAAAEASKPIPAAEKTPTTLSDYLKYASLGLTGAGLLSKAFGSGLGGKASGAGGSGTFTPDKLPDIFSAKLPGVGTGAGGGTGFNTSTAPYGATDPGAGGQNLTAEDYYKYGYGPEKSFFKNIPGRPIGMAKGGSPNRFAVRGPGTGRSDDIPANLSDGEYVIDAETVALLGDGSSKAGADKLDRFRVNVRKHKGKSLAAGRFSVAAKQPEAYLKGRR
jgi:hypothetical protein